jgi:hypothetical protein
MKVPKYPKLKNSGEKYNGAGRTNGKGSRDRTRDREKFRSGYDGINWSAGKRDASHDACDAVDVSDVLRGIDS